MYSALQRPIPAICVRVSITCSSSRVASDSRSSRPSLAAFAIATIVFAFLRLKPSARIERGWAAASSVGSGNACDAIRGDRRASAVAAGQPIQERETRGERELLQRDRVHETLENTGKAGWVQPAKAPRERRELRIAGSEGVEGIEVEVERHHPLESGARLRQCVGGSHGAVQGDAKQRRIRSAVLAYGDFDGRIIEHKHATVRRSVPCIDLV